MKKLYFFLVAMICAFAANATDYYLIGGFNGWKLADASCKFTATSTAGVYTLKLNKDLTSGFKVNDGTWGNENVNFGSNGNKLVPGTAYKYGVGSSTGNIEIDGVVAKPTITLDLNNGTLLVEGAAGTAEITYALHGSFASSDWADVNLTEQAGKWVANNVTVSYASAEFGIKENTNGNQSAWIAATEEGVKVSGSTVVNLKVDGKNIKIAAGTYSFSLDVAAKKLTITADGVAPDPDPETKTYTCTYDNAKTAWDEVYVYVWDGSKNNGEFPGVKMTAPAAGSTVWSYSVELAFEPKNIIFSDGKEGGKQTDDLVFVDGKAYGVGDDTPEAQTYTCSYDNAETQWTEVWAYVWRGVKSNAAYPGVKMTAPADGKTVWSFSAELTFEPEYVIFSDGTNDDSKKTADLDFVEGKTYGAGSVTPDPEDHVVYIVTSGVDWNLELSPSTTEVVNNVATIEVPNWDSKWTFKIVVDGTWYGSNTNPEADVTLTVEQNNQWIDGANVKEGGMENHFQLPDEANGRTVVFNVAVDNYGAFKANWTNETGIEAISAENEEAVYYNLQGVRVENPACGVYIQVRGNKVSKVLVK